MNRTVLSINQSASCGLRLLYRFHSRDRVCVHCGSPVKHLKKVYSPTVLKLVNCEICGEIADKYLEYDDVVIWIDVILFNKQAYRHLLFNSNFQNHWKLALLVLIAKTIDKWSCLNPSVNVSPCQTKADYEDTVYAFCFNFVITILGETLFLCIIISFLIFFWNTPFCRNDFLRDTAVTWKAVVSSSFGHFLLIPSLIWNDSQREVYFILILVYTLLSHIQALTVVFKIQRPILAMILVVAELANYMVCTNLRWYFNAIYNLNV